MHLVAFMIILLVSADPAYAYMGPGAGLAFLGSLIALIAALGVGVLGLVWYPVKRFLRSRRGDERDEKDPS